MDVVYHKYINFTKTLVGCDSVLNHVCPTKPFIAQCHSSYVEICFLYFRNISFITSCYLDNFLVRNSHFEDCDPCQNIYFNERDIEPERQARPD